MRELKGQQAEMGLRGTTVKDDVESDPNLMAILKQAKRDIQDKNYYTSEEMRELIREDEI